MVCHQRDDIHHNSLGPRCSDCHTQQTFIAARFNHDRVGCTLTAHVQDNRIIKITSPLENGVTQGNLCVKGRFGFEYVNEPGAGDEGLGAGACWLGARRRAV
jgi:hypothetical protein